MGMYCIVLFRFNSNELATKGVAKGHANYEKINCCTMVGRERTHPAGKMATTKIKKKNINTIKGKRAHYKCCELEEGKMGEGQRVIWG